MNKRLLLIGEGQLLELVKKQLINRFDIVHHLDALKEPPEEGDFALVLHDMWSPATHEHVEHLLREKKIPWIRAFIAFGEAMIGPLVTPTTVGCTQCADHRRLMAGQERKQMWEIQHFLHEAREIEKDVSAIPISLMMITNMIISEVENFFMKKNLQTEKHVYLMNMTSCQITRHYFLPNPLCPICSQLPDDQSEEAIIRLQSSRKVSEKNDRARSLNELSTFLKQDYYDPKMGFLNQQMIDFVPPFADMSVNLPLFEADEGAAGRTNSYAISELTAILEGLERYCGIQPRGKRTSVQESYSIVKEFALHPNSLGVHSKDQYALKDFPFQKFDENKSINWVWGYSFEQERPLLVPERLAYYSLGYDDGFVYETSNGCALGGSLEEAILYGIMEVVERDSFLLTWYAKLSLPRIDHYSANDVELNLMINRANMVAGYEIQLYNATMEHGIPSVWALAKNKKKKGLNLICAAGAHLNPIKAAKSAIHELGGMMLTLDEKFEKNQSVYEQMLTDSSLVKQMDDHGMLFGLPQAEERLAFLLNSKQPVQTFEEAYPVTNQTTDLMEDLQECLLTLQRVNLDVIVVNQTTPEIEKNGLHCVKVIIPGMLPMTFGHHLTRIHGLNRILTVPKELGYENRELRLEELNHFPHPFP